LGLKPEERGKSLQKLRVKYDKGYTLSVKNGADRIPITFEEIQKHYADSNIVSRQKRYKLRRRMLHVITVGMHTINIATNQDPTSRTAYDRINQHLKELIRNSRTPMLVPNILINEVERLLEDDEQREGVLAWITWLKDNERKLTNLYLGAYPPIYRQHVFEVVKNVHIGIYQLHDMYNNLILIR